MEITMQFTSTPRSMNLSFNFRRPIAEIHLEYISMVSDACDLRQKVQFCFVIHSAGKQLFLQAEGETDMNQWIDATNNTKVNGSEELSDHAITSLKSGFCVKQGAIRKNWKRRYFVLNEDGLSYFKSEQSRRPLRTISKNDILGVQEPESNQLNRDNLMNILTVKRVFYVQCDSKADLASWISALKKLLGQQKSQQTKPSQESTSILPLGSDIPPDSEHPKAFWI